MGLAGTYGCEVLGGYSQPGYRLNIVMYDENDDPINYFTKVFSTNNLSVEYDDYVRPGAVILSHYGVVCYRFGPEFINENVANFVVIFNILANPLYND